ncbi:DEAD/DEAH box helicase [Campylobacter jejuni]|nr:DEAD/DEAH box helicase [Campylobacter jejuni]
MNSLTKLQNLKIGALFMDIGTGKTKTILDIYAKKGIDHKIVYITPSSLIKSTKKECLKWYNYNINFFSSESISQSDYIYSDLVNFIKENKVFLIIDESIKFKNIDAKRTERLLNIANLCEYRFILNGTPITRSILDLLTQMNILSPKILNMNEIEFAKNFLEYEINSKKQKSWRIWSKPHNEKALMKMIEPYTLYGSFDFENKIFIENKIFHLNDDELREYSLLKSELCKYDNIDFFSVSQKLQRFYTECLEKIEFLRKYNKKDTLFFSKFLFWQDILEDIFENIGVFNGNKKDDLNNYDLALVSYGSGAYGLNLQKFKRIVFLDTTFNYGEKIQSIGRVKRKGQDNDIEVINLIVNTGLENIILKSLEKKTKSEENIRKILNNMKREDILECL